MTEKLLSSTEEARRVVGSLTSLLHYKNEFDKFPTANLEMIVRGGH